MNYELLVKIKSKNSSIFYNSVKPDMIKDSRVEKLFVKKGNIITYNVKSDDIAVLRASVNSFLRNIQLLNNSLKVVEK